MLLKGHNGWSVGNHEWYHASSPSLFTISHLLVTIVHNNYHKSHWLLFSIDVTKEETPNRSIGQLQHG